MSSVSSHLIARRKQAFGKFLVWDLEGLLPLILKVNRLDE